MSWSALTATLWPASDNLRRHRDEVRVVEDVPYVTDALPKQRLDLFVPRGDGPFPALLFFHGGFWKTQDRKLARWLTGLYANVGVALARAGIAVAIPSFRQDRYAHTERDALAAVAWVRAHGREHGLDGDRLSLAGHSAGGNLALTLAWDPERRAGPVCAAVSMCSVYDLPRLLAAAPSALPEADARRYFVDDAAMERASPERHVRAGGTPAMLVTSTGDDPSLRAEHAAFVAALQARGARHEALSLPDVGHMGVAMELGRRRDRVTPAVSRFVLARAFEAGLATPVDVIAALDGALRPARPRLAAARAAVEGAASGADAWARLTAAGLLPASWADDARRCFGAYVACARCRGSGHGDHGGPCLRCHRTGIDLAPPRDAPPSVAAATAIASLADDALTNLEALAWRAAEALVPWRGAPPTRVCWCVTDASAWRRRGFDTVEPSRHADAACDAAGRGTEGFVRAFEQTLDARETSPGELELLADHEGSLAWTTAARAGLRVVACRGAPEGVAPPVGTEFASLPDPFAPRCAAWRRGCAIDVVERDGTVVVVVPIAR